MQTLAQGFRGVSLLLDLNWDRLLYVATLCGALWGGAFLGSMGLN